MESDSEMSEEAGVEKTIKEAKTDTFKYEILEPWMITESRAKLIKQVEDIAQLSVPKCRALLIHFHWNMEKVMESYYTGDSEAVLRKAEGASTVPSKAEALFCEICLETKTEAKDMVGLECGHGFCVECWRGYLRHKIMNEGVALTLPCPSHDCKRLMGEEAVQRLLEEDPNGEEIGLRYQRLITNSFVEASKLIRWCPRGECGRAVRVTTWEAGRVVCKCGKAFCFGCGEEWHEPVSCHYLKAWIKKSNDDSETSNWIAANTKSCPKCHTPIEKNGGCNHMTCTSTICKHEFCWVCHGPWTSHVGRAGYDCNRFNEEAKATQDVSREALNRYLHYATRYTNHQQSLKLEHKLYATVKGKMEEMQSAHMSWIEVQFLNSAVDSLCAARRTLCYTYAFAYYLKSNNQAKIFQDNQGDLEMATEHLSGLLERDLGNQNLVSLKQKVQDKARYCDQRRSALLKHCMEGVDNDVWQYQD